MRTYDIPLRGTATFFRIVLSEDEFTAWRDYLVSGGGLDQPGPGHCGELVTAGVGVTSLAIVTDFLLEQTAKGLALVVEVTDVDGGIYESVPIR